MLAAGSEFFRVQAEMIGITQHLFKQHASFLDLVRTCECFNKPKGTGGEEAFVAFDSIEANLVAITVDQSVDREVTLDSLQGRKPLGIRRADEPDERHEQYSRIQARRALVLHKALEFVIPEVGVNIFRDGVTTRFHPLKWTCERALCA